MKVIHFILGILLGAGCPSLTAQEITFSGRGGFAAFPAEIGLNAPLNRSGLVGIQASKSAEILMLLYTNREQDAMEQSAAHLRALVPSFLSRDAGERSAYERESTFPEFLRVYGLADRLAAALRPGEGATVEDRIVYAAVAEMLGEVETAVKDYGAILNQRPRHDGVRTRSFFLAIEQAELEAAAGHLRGLSTEALVPLGEALWILTRSTPEDEYDRRLDYVEMLVTYFEEMDPKRYVPADWLLNLLDHYLGQGNWGNKIRFRDLYATTDYSVGYSGTAQEERSRKVEERRRQVHQRLCQALIKLPQFAEVGFQRLSGLALRDGENVAEFEKLAFKVLMEMPPPPERPAELAKSPNPYRSQFRNDWVPFLTPAEFLFRVATERGDYRVLEGQVIPGLAARDRGQVVSFLQDMMALASATGEAFVARAVAVLRREERVFQLGNVMRRILEMHEAQGGSEDIGPILGAYFKAMRFEPYQSPSFVGAYGKAKFEEGSQAFAKFIDDTAVAMLGPVEGQKPLIERYYQPNLSSTDTPGRAIVNYVGFLAQMMESPATAAKPLKKAFELGLIHPGDYQIRNRLQDILRYYRLDDDPQGVYQFLIDMGFLGDPESFEFYPMGNVTRGTVFGYLLYSLNRVESSKKARVKAPIEEHPKDTFGKAVILALMESSTSSSRQRVAITRTVEPYMDRILKLSPDQQEKFLYWYGQMVGNNSLSTSLARAYPKIGARYKQWRAGQTGGHQMVTLEGFLEVERREVLDRQFGLDHVAGQLVQEMTPGEGLEKLDPFIRHYLKLASQPLAYQPDSEPVPRLERLLATWLAKAKSIGALGTAVHFLKVGELTGEPLESDFIQAVRSTLQEVLFQNPAGEATGFLQSSQGHYDDRLTPLFAERFAHLEAGVTQGILAWASADESALGRAWGEAAALHVGLTPEVEARWLARLTGEDGQPLTRRLKVAPLIASSAVRARAWPVVRGCVDTFAQAWKDEKLVVMSREAGGFLALLMASDDEEAVPLAKLLLEQWTPHLEETPMELEHVARVLRLDAGYGLDKADWVSRLPQAILRQPGFLVMMLKNATAEQALSALPWAYLAMPPAEPQRGGNRSFRRSGSVSRLQPDLGGEPMSKDLWVKLRAFLPAVPDPGERFFTELLVSALPDGRGLEGVPPRSERLKALNGKYDREAFSSPYLAEHAVSWLCVLNGFTDETREAVRHFGDRIDVRAMSEWGDASLRTSRQRILKLYIQDAAQNSPAAFAKLLSAMLEEAGADKGEAQQLLEVYCQDFPLSILRNVRSIDQETARSYLPLLRKLAVLSREISWGGRSACVSANFAMHALANDAAGYRDWVAELDENTRAGIASETDLEQVAYLLRDGLNDGDLSQERRFDILNGLFTVSAPTDDPFSGSRPSGSSGSRVFQRLIELGILKKEEVLQYGPSWAELNPRQGHAYGELAKYQEEAKQLEEAVLSYLQAVVHTPLNSNSSYTRYHLAKTNLLLRLKRVDAAMSWIEFFDRGRLYSSNKEEFELLSRKTRFRYLMAPERAEAILSETRLRLGQDERDYASWRRLAEILSAAGDQRINASDYAQGLAFLKLSFYILHRLEDLDSEFDKAQFLATKRDLARCMLAIGLGGKRRTLLAKRSRWDYHYQHGGIAGSMWRRPGYAMDAKWRKGRAPFGYGDGDETTVLNYGKDKKNRPITAYFRKTFEVEDPGKFDELTIGVLHDDGMMVYLNGTLLVRNNMPRTAIRPDSLAPRSRGSETENKFWAAKFSASRLLPGTNLITAEVHQNDASSSDMGFDLEIAAEAINASEVAAEVESGAVMKRLATWAEQRLPANVVDIVRGL